MGNAAGRPFIPAEAPEPTPLGTRALAPDLARGIMLLLIALANAHLYLFGQRLEIRGYPADPTAIDRVVAVIQLLFVDGRAYPLFALLFGYGIVQLAWRQANAGRDAVSTIALIRQRGAWLMMFGLVHAALLFAGDIIGVYGLLAVLLAGILVTGTDRTLLWLAGLGLVFTGLLGVAMAWPGLPAQTTVLASLSEPNPINAAATRVLEWMGGLPSALALAAGVALGAWAARRRLLDEPARNRRLLSRLAGGGLGLAVLGGLPIALIAAGRFADPPLFALGLAGAMHSLSGYAGGIGYAALIGLLAVRYQEQPSDARTTRIVTALVACGQRSMTCYLLQSVVFVALLASYGGRLGDDLGVAAASGIGLLTWALTVLAADVMRRFGVRGPAESLLRRLTYGPKRAPRAGSPKAIGPGEG